MTTKIYRIILCIAISTVILITSGCVKDTLYNTPHPDQAALEVTTDWSGISKDAVVPGTYMIRVGEEIQTVSGEKNVFRSLLDPGHYNLLIYNKPNGITIRDITATVNTLVNGTLDPNPGFLFSGYNEFDTPVDDTLKVKMPMNQHIRSLNMELKLTPEDALRLKRTTAVLSGIASSVDLITGKIVSTKGKLIIPMFTLNTESSGASEVVHSGVVSDYTMGNPVLAASLRIFGIMSGEKQELTLNVTLTNNTVHTIKTDLTDYLKNFGSGEIEPLVLDATLTLPVEAGIEVTISDWNIVNNGIIIIN